MSKSSRRPVSRLSIVRASVFTASFALGALAVASEPCSSTWVRGQGAAGRSDSVLAQTLWDPDGDGPRGPVVLVAGGPGTARGAIVGNIEAGSISSWDPATGVWEKVADPVDGVIRALAVLPDGSIVAGGSFLTAGNVQAQNIARWDGTRWNAWGLGVYGTVRVIVPRPDGSVVVGGEFNRAGGTTLSNIARWNGQTWSRVGDGGVAGPVNAITELQDGSLVVAGRFQRADRVANTANIARWTGSAWVSIGGGLVREVFDVERTPSGAVLAASNVGASEGGIFKLNGQTWEVLSGGLAQSPRALLVLGETEFIAAGDFQGAASTAPPYGVGWWRDGEWQPVGGGVRGSPFCLTGLPGGGFVMGGAFREVATTLAANISHWNGAEWLPLGTGVSGYVSAIAVLPDDRVIVGCDLSLGVTGTRFMVKDGEEWTRLGQDFPNGANPAIRSVLVLPTGELVANGSFAFPGDQFLTGVVRFDGQEWVRFPQSPIFPRADLVAGEAGEFFASGEYTPPGGVRGDHVVRWTGDSWTTLGSGMNAPVSSLVRGPSGDLYAGGFFSLAGGTPVNGLARWDGARWQSLQFSERGTVDSVAILPDGRVAVCFPFGPDPEGFFSEVALLENGVWRRLGGRIAGPQQLKLHARPDGTLLAFGPIRLADGSRVQMIRWTGSEWVPISDGIDSDIVCALSAPDGDLLVGGYFERAGEHVSRFFARLHEPRPLRIGRQADSARLCLNGRTTFSVEVAEGSPDAVRWEAQLADGSWVPLTDGELRSDRGTLLGHLDGSATLSLTIELNPNMAASSSYRAFRCRVENDCGAVSSEPATLAICAADFNCDGFIDFFDYDGFVACFESGECGPDQSADVNVDGFEDFFDYLDFVSAFESGC
jgi:hypothetical protein